MKTLTIDWKEICLKHSIGTSQCKLRTFHEALAAKYEWVVHLLSTAFLVLKMQPKAHPPPIKTSTCLPAWSTIPCCNLFELPSWNNKALNVEVLYSTHTGPKLFSLPLSASSHSKQICLLHGNAKTFWAAGLISPLITRTADSYICFAKK